MFDVIQTTLAAAVADNGTFTVAYPTGRGAGSYTGAYAHKMVALGTTYSAPTAFTVAFTTVATVTWKADTTLPAGSTVVLQLERIGVDEDSVPANKSYPNLALALISLGTPVVGAANSVCLSQSLDGTPAHGTAALINGSTAGVLDYPRNIVAAWTNTAVLRVHGTDEFGVAVREESGSGNSFAGKKAFKTVTAVTVSADVTGLTVGHGDVLGLPFRLPSTAYVLKELADGAVPSAGTIVAGVTTAATATTGDVRGTVDPATTLDGAVSVQLLVVATDLSDRGVPQYAG